MPISRRAGDAMEHLSATGPVDRIFVRDRGRILPVTVHDIERLEADDDYVAVHSRGRRYLVYLGMNAFEERLDPRQFLRIHRSHIVNLEYVTVLTPFDATRLQVEMKDGTKLVASRTRSRELRGLAI